jgi:hypothetical protein
MQKRNHVLGCCLACREDIYAAHAEGWESVHVQARMSHWISDGADGEELDGSYCYWNHDGEPLKPSASKQPRQPRQQQSNGRLISRAP